MIVTIIIHTIKLILCIFEVKMVKKIDHTLKHEILIFCIKCHNICKKSSTKVNPCGLHMTTEHVQYLGQDTGPARYETSQTADVLIFNNNESTNEQQLSSNFSQPSCTTVEFYQNGKQRFQILPSSTRFVLCKQKLKASLYQALVQRSSLPTTAVSATCVWSSNQSDFLLQPLGESWKGDKQCQRRGRCNKNIYSRRKQGVITCVGLKMEQCNSVQIRVHPPVPINQTYWN